MPAPSGALRGRPPLGDQHTVFTGQWRWLSPMLMGVREAHRGQTRGQVCKYESESPGPKIHRNTTPDGRS